MLFFFIMRHLLLFCLLLPSFILFAQESHPRDSGQAFRGVETRTASPRQQVAVKEAEVSRLISYYEVAAPAERDNLRPQVYLLLRELFELNLLTLEGEAQQLRHQLEALAGNQAYEDRTADIQLLKSTLAEVEARLAFRREHRDRIVQQRLHDLLD